MMMTIGFVVHRDDLLLNWCMMMDLKGMHEALVGLEGGDSCLF